MTRWRVQPDVGEIEVESDEYSIFGPARVEDFGIRIASETLVDNSLHVVTGAAQQWLGVPREILVQLEPDRHLPS